MALSITPRGTGTHNTGALSFTLSPTSNFAAGSTAVLCVSADNASSAGATNDFGTVTDTLGNTWVRQQNPVFDNGAASAGVQGAIYTSELASALQTSTVITVNFGASTIAKTWAMWQVAPAAGSIARYRTGGTKAAGATSTTAAGNATTGASASVDIGEVLVAAIFIEAGTTLTVTADSDTTNGTWATMQYAEIGSTTSGSAIASQAKLQTTAASTQSYDVTTSLASDYHGAYVILQEVVAPTLVTPTSAAAIASAADPTVTLGGLGATPTPGTATATATAPTIALGGITSTPTPAVAAASAADPVVVNEDSGQEVTPTTAVAIASAASPTVTLGGITATPTVAVAASSAANPTTTLGAITVTPTPAVATGQATAPVVALGGVGATPVPASATALAADPTSTTGSVVIPTPGIATAGGAAPNVLLGPINATPAAAGASSSGAGPTIELGPLTVTALAGLALALGANPEVGAVIVFAAIGALASAAAAVSTQTSTASVATDTSDVVVLTAGSSAEVT